ncbi:DUF2207 domain-containing protein [Erysipelothrix piscisicarius]|uniref:DUF2207 domain-containing protein n=1 Tax=Erysipelothrix piscisicarius TaxID=2485784 RepID=A0A3S5HJZ6_9FIRM|nr:DUF2207 domain-containing protein [Erysipelothrix piscisicarius]AZK43572.1 DUF2207 domain-containing protein [Erysipelothrix piscisicarius]
MKRIKQLIFAMVLALTLFITPLSANETRSKVASLPSPTSSDIQNHYKDYGFPVVGESFDIALDVKEDGRINVNIVLDAYFYEPRQGIFVTIADRYNDYDFGNGPKDYVFPTSDIRVKNRDVEIDHNSDGAVLKIGTPGKFLQGSQRYEFSYVINTRDLELEQGDLLYQNLITQYWDFPMMKTSFKIQMPKSFDATPKFYATAHNLPVEYKVDGTTITGSFNQPLYQEALSVWLDLPHNYFVFPIFDKTPITVGIAGVLALIMAILFFKYGREYPIVDTVEFSAPYGLSSAETGYVYRGYSKSNDIVSLIIYWASKGYLTIEELDEKGKNIKLTKIAELSDVRNREELRVFNALFKNREEVTTKELNTKFGNVISNATASLSLRFRQNKEERIFSKSSTVLKTIGMFVAPIGIAIVLASVGYARMGIEDDAYIFGIMGYSLFMVLGIFGYYATSFDGVAGTRKPKSMSLLFFIISAIATVALTIATGWCFKNPLPMILAYVFFLISVVSVANMGRRTKIGSEWYGQILGLKRFIEVAEQSRLEALAEETPEIFYDILPYAYVLGVTDVWSKKFESIAIQQPDWYISSQPNFSTYYMWHSLSRSMNTLQASMVSIPAPTASSGGGGSFGSGGGGGFSGGGFGGTGGGSW